MSFLTTLKSHSIVPGSYPDHFKKAATAMIVHAENGLHTDENLEMLFIRRAHHEQDPWSGHMALPGGRIDPEDTDPLACAIRETQEEVGIHLVRDDCVCAVREIRGSARGKLLDLVVFPFVFHWKGTRTEVIANDEVAETVWVPISIIRDQSKHTTFELSYQDIKKTMPCIEHNSHRIWGMTYRMLQNLNDALL